MSSAPLSSVWWKTVAVLLWRYIRQRDPHTGFRLVQAASDLFYPGYPFVDPRLDWRQEASFAAYLDRFDTAGQMNAMRRWTVRQLLRLTTAVPGDTAECGVFIGAGSWLMCASNLGTTKTHHIFDSFEGLSDPGAYDGDFWSRGNLACGEEDVRRNLSQFGADAVRLYKGWIPTRFADVADRTFSFVHIDVDLEDPTFDSIAFFYPRLSPGGILLCDDYAFTICPGATRAIDRFLADKPERMISAPAGGGFFIKGLATAADAPLPAVSR